jgi:adenylate cyclase
MSHADGMIQSRRDRRDWRIFFWVGLASAIVSAAFGVNIAPPDETWLHGAAQGVTTSLLVATPLLLFELRSARPGALRRLRRLPLPLYFAIKVLVYAVVILLGLIASRLIMAVDFEFDAMFRSSVFFAIAMSLAGNLTFEMVGLLGFGTLKSLMTGHYVQPKREQRAFLLIDMKDSTGMAERLGAMLFHELLNDFFRDIADAALECEAEIHKYVGDEAILTWKGGAALADGDCLRCPFIARDLMKRHGPAYLARFGAIPSFRASIHYGEVVAGEIGDVRREIAYVGDTLNVAARLLEAAKELGHDVLVSDDVLARAPLPEGLGTIKLPMLTVRGRAAPLGVSSLESV